MMISVDTIINSNIEKVWKNWSDTEAVKVWNHASDDWYCPHATNDFQPGGSFSYTMSSVDNQQSFDFFGMYTKIDSLKSIESTLGDGRKVSAEFEKVDDHNTIVTESFETENQNSVEAQRTGWQAILDNFRNYCESSN